MTWSWHYGLNGIWTLQYRLETCSLVSNDVLYSVIWAIPYSVIELVVCTAMRVGLIFLQCCHFSVCHNYIIGFIQRHKEHIHASSKLNQKYQSSALRRDPIILFYSNEVFSLLSAIGLCSDFCFSSQRVIDVSDFQRHNAHRQNMYQVLSHGVPQQNMLVLWITTLR